MMAEKVKIKLGLSPNWMVTRPPYPVVSVETNYMQENKWLEKVLWKEVRKERKE